MKTINTMSDGMKMGGTSRAKLVLNMTAFFIGIMILSSLTSLVDAAGNATEVTVPCNNNKTDCASSTVATPTDETDSFFSTEFKVCAGIAAAATVIAIVCCIAINQKAKSGGYASGGNVPKSMIGSGLSDDF